MNTQLGGTNIGTSDRVPLVARARDFSLKATFFSLGVFLSGWGNSVLALPDSGYGGLFPGDPNFVLNPAHLGFSGFESVQFNFTPVNLAQDDLAEALRLVNQGQFDLALAKSSGFVTLNPLSASGHEVLGLVLVLQGRIDEGVTHLQRAIQINPKQSTAVTKLGDVYLARGETAKAKLQFQQAVALDPDDRFPHQRLGMILEQEMDYPQAVEHLEKGLRGSPPGYVGIKVNLGRIYNLGRQFRKTIDLLSPVVNEQCQDAPAQLVLGTAWLLAQDPKKALVCFERARKHDSSPERAHLALGIAYRDAGDAEKSRQELEIALKAKADWSLGEYQMAETLVALKRIKDAVAYFEKVAARDATARTSLRNRIGEVYSSHGEPDAAIKVYQALRADGTANVRTYEGLVTVLQLSHRSAEAEELLREADRKFPNNLQIQYRLGMHLSLVRDYDRAIEVLRHARELAPADPRIQKAISLTALRRNDLGAAIAEAKRLLEIVPDSHDDQYYLATLLEQGGKDAEAEQLYERVLRHSPDHVGSLNNLAQVRLRKNSVPAALALAEKAARLAPENPFVLDTLGWIRFKSGKVSEAIPPLEKAVGVAAPSPGHRYHLAVLYAKLGQGRKALEQLDVALGQDVVFQDRDAARRLADELRKR